MKIKLLKSCKNNKAKNEMIVVIKNSITGFYDNSVIHFSSILELSFFINREGFKFEERIYE